MKSRVEHTREPQEREVNPYEKSPGAPLTGLRALFGRKFRLALPFLMLLASDQPISKVKHVTLNTGRPQISIHVEEGDTLSGIAREHGVTIEQIKELNKLSTDTIHVGQALSIPGTGEEREVTLERLKPDEPNQYVYKEEGKWYSIQELGKEGAEKFPSKEWSDHPKWDESRLGTGERHFNGDLSELPITLKDVQFIILHSTIAGKSESVSDTKKAHFVIERDGTIRYLVHIEKEKPEDGKATPQAGLSNWNGVEGLNEHSIGIEAVALEKQEYSPEQIASVKPLIEWLGGYFGLSKNAVLRHGQIAYGDHLVAEALNEKFPDKPKTVMTDGRGRKSDPIDANLWVNLGLPDNDRLLDLSTVKEDVPFDPERYKRNTNPYEGLQAAVELSAED